MGLLSFLGKGLDIVSDFIPGGNIVQGALEAVVPQAKSFFEGTLDQPRTEGGQMLPALPPVAGLPALPASGSLFPMAAAASLPAALPAAVPAGGGKGLPWWKGPGGGMQLPWNDPKVAEYLKQFALDDSYLKVYYRAPKGYVVVRDASGRPFPLDKRVAKFFSLWKPAAKPPISATEWKYYKGYKRISKKLKKVAATEISAARASARRSAKKPKRRAA